jgi:hypothetical protein
MASKKVDPRTPPEDDVQSGKAEKAPARASKRPGPVRRNTIEVELSWLEVDAPVITPPKKEPALREEKIVWRKAPAEGQQEEPPPKVAPLASRPGAYARQRPVIIRKALPREEEPKPEPEPARASSASARRSKRPPPQAIPREEAADSMPPPRRNSKAPPGRNSKPPRR